MCLLLATSQKSSRHQVEMEARSTARDCQRGNCTTSQDDSLCQGCPWCENGSLDCCRERSKTLCPVTSWRANHVSFIFYFFSIYVSQSCRICVLLCERSPARHTLFSFFLTNDNHRNESIVFEADCKTTRTSSDSSFSYTFFSCSNNNNNKH